MKQYFKLNKDVFVVDGAKNHAIYDLNNKKLYHIDTEFLEFLRKLLNNPKWNFNKIEKSNLKLLNKNKIIIESDNLEEEKSILSLKNDSKPYFAWLEITQQCNFKCVFCYEESNCYIDKFMKMDDFYKAVNFLINYGVKEIQFIGGEPMLHPKLKDMIEYCHDKFDFIEVYTNASFINQEWCDFFKKYNIRVAVSFHSYIPEEFEKITQTSGSYKLVKKGIDLILKNNLKSRFAAIKNKNVKIGEKLKNFNIRLNAQSPRLIGRGKIDQFNLEMFKEIAITKDTFRRIIDKNNVIKAISGHQCFNKNLYVAYNLEVFPCPMEKRLTHGFITGENNIDLVNKNICHHNKDCIKICKDCEFRYVCYDCRPNSNGGDIYDKPWNCSYNPISGEWENIELMFERLQKM